MRYGRTDPGNNKKESCGAIFYSFDDDQRIGIILGLEGNHWLPFKGCKEENETAEDAAMREIREETCDLVKLNHIDLEHQFSTRYKNYRIGLCQVPYNIVKLFDCVNKRYKDYEYKEKLKLKFFTLDEIFEDNQVHFLSRLSVRHYWTKLLSISKEFPLKVNYRRQSVCVDFAREYCNNHIKKFNEMCTIN